MEGIECRNIFFPFCYIQRETENVRCKLQIIFIYIILIFTLCICDSYHQKVLTYFSNLLLIAIENLKLYPTMSLVGPCNRARCLYITSCHAGNLFRFKYKYVSCIEEHPLAITCNYFISIQ